jgi:hypothetical protein
MTTNNSRDEMLARGLAKGGTAETRLITNRPRLFTFDLYGFDGSYLGSLSATSAQAAHDEWIRLHGVVAGLVEELD